MQQHRQLALQRAIDRDHCDAGNAAEAIRQLILREARDLRVALRGRRQRQLHDRLRRRIEPREHRLAHLGGQLVAHRGDGVAHLVARLDQVLAEVEDQHDLRVALAGGGAHLVDAGDALQRLLDAVDELALDGVGRRAGVVDADHQHRLLDIGDLVDAQLVQREQPERHQRDDDDDRGDRPLDAEVGEEHGVRSPSWRKPRCPWR